MRRIIFASLALAAATFVLVVGAQESTPGAKKPDDRAKQIKEDLTLREQILARQFAEFEQALLKLKQRLDKSPKAEDRDRGVLLGKALDKAKENSIGVQFEQIVEFLKNRDLKSLPDVKDAADRSTRLAENLREILALLREDTRASKLRDERLRLEQLVKEIERIIREQQTAQALTDRGVTQKTELKKIQGDVTDATAKVAKQLGGDQGGEGKNSKGDAKEAGKEGGKAGEAKEAGKEQGGKKAESKEAGKPGESKSGEAKSGEKGAQGSKAGEPKAGEAKAGKGSDSKGGDAKPSKGGEGSKGGEPKESKGGQGKEGEAKDAGKEDKASSLKKKAEAKSGDQGEKKDPSDKQGGAKSKGGDGQKEAGAKNSKGGDKKAGDSKSGGESKQGDAKSGDKSSGQSSSKSSGQPGQQPPQQAGSKGDNQPQPPPKGGNQDQQAQNGKKQVQDANYKQKQAEEEIAKGANKPASDKQGQAIEDLEKAKKKLEDLLNQIREEELERLLAALQLRCEKMLAMQIAVLHGTEQVYKNIENTPGKKADRPDQQKSLKLSDDEKEIVLEASKAIEMLEAEGSAVAFPEVFQQVREDMKHVQRRLGVVDAGIVTQGIEKDIIESLKEMIEALKKAKKELDDKKSPPSPPSGKQGPPPDQKLLDQIAELKMIRSMQKRVNDRTQLYGKQYQDRDGEQAADLNIRTELRNLSERQERIFDVTNRIAKGDNK